MAAALFDLADTNVDCGDDFSDGFARIFSRLRACDDYSLQDFFDGGDTSEFGDFPYHTANSPSCNYNTGLASGGLCTFNKAALRNGINLNKLPTGTVTTQTVTPSEYVAGPVTVSASVSDPECGNPASVVFVYGIASSARSGPCTYPTPNDEYGGWIGTRTSPPFSVGWDTTGTRGGQSLEICIRANDGLREDAIAHSTGLVVIDNDPPWSLTYSPTTQPDFAGTYVGPYIIPWDVQDNLAGLAGTGTFQEMAHCITWPAATCTSAPGTPNYNNWVTISACSNVALSGQSVQSGSCRVDPVGYAWYCYRLLAHDVLGNDDANVPGYGQYGGACVVAS